MRRTVLSTLMLMLMAVMGHVQGFAADKIVANELTFKVGDKTTQYLKVELKGSMLYTGYEMWLQLPDGITVAKTKKGKDDMGIKPEYIYAFDDEDMTYSHSVTGEYHPESNRVKFACIPLTKEPFESTDGILFHVGLVLTDAAVAGEYDITINDIYMIDPDSQNHPYDNVSVKLTIESDQPAFKPGDINEDDVVDVYDYTKLQDFIGQDNTLDDLATDREKQLYDVNEDETLDVADLRKLVIYIMRTANPSYPDNTESNAKGSKTTAVADGGVMNFRVEDNVLIADLKNDIDCSCLQVDIEIPGAEVKAKQVCDRAKNHNISVYKNGDGKYRVMVLTMSDALIDGKSGDVFRLSLDGKADAVNVSNAIASDRQAVSHAVSIGSVITGVNSIESDVNAATVYTLGGQLTNGTTRGISVVTANGKTKKIVEK